MAGKCCCFFFCFDHHNSITHSKEQEQHVYQAVVVGKRLGDEDVGQLLHQDPLAVQTLQVGHGVRL